MKLSDAILSTTLACTILGIFGSNVIMKKEYDRIDKSDPYWNYGALMAQPFRHLVITGGNVTNIFYEQSPKYAVKVMKAWRGFRDGSVQTHVSNDTLYVNFSNQYESIYEKFWLSNVVPVRIFSPGLLSVTGYQTKLIVDKFDRPDIKINITENSKVQVNCYRNVLERIEVSQKDSCMIAFRVSEDLFVPDAITIHEAAVSGTGTSLLNVKSCRIEKLGLHLEGSASIALSGYTLGQLEAMTGKSAE